MSITALRSIFISLVVATGSLAACGGQVVQFDNDGDPAPDATPFTGPTVIATVPADNGFEVPTGAALTATFSQPMDDATITEVTFTLAQGDTSIGGSVTFDGATDTATFTPDDPLTLETFYTATITIGARNAEGIALENDYVWTFRTADDNLPPTVTSTTPVDNAVNVSINKRPTATFSRAMLPSSLNASTFTLYQGATQIFGTVSLDGETNTAMFTPNAPLEIDLVYTATITTGALDAGGVALLVDYTWDFTTSNCSQAPVVLGAAGSYAVLAGSTVTSTGATSLTGNLGVSPGTAVTGFPPGIITGVQNAGNSASAQAMAALTTAYNDAKGRTLCAVTVAGNLGGTTRAPGLYKSTSSLEVSSGDLTLDAQGDGDAVFIFQMASTLTVTSGRNVVLINGAKASNVFWQVGTSATLGTGSTFKGTILADQAITLTNLATLSGRALARIAAVTMSANTIVTPAP